MATRVTYAGLRLSLIEGWADITPDLPAGSPPSLAKPGGVGCLQFSVAQYRRGPRPTIRERELYDLLKTFSDAHPELGPASNVVTQSAPDGFTLLTADYPSAAETTRVWYVSSGEDLAFVTYIGSGADRTTEQGEIADADVMVRSIGF